MILPKTIQPAEICEALNRDGYVVVENVIPTNQIQDFRTRIEDRITLEKAHPVDPGESMVTGTQADEVDFTLWQTRDEEEAVLRRRIRHRQAEEFDTPWPVSANDVCINFIHVPTSFDNGRSRRVVNVINKDTQLAELAEHPLILQAMEIELGRDLILLDASINQVGAQTNTPGGWHIDSPLTQITEPLPNLTLSIQTAWMLDDFRADNGATHVATGSNHTLQKPPPGRAPLDNEIVLAGPAGSVAIWLSQTWHRHGANIADDQRTGFIVQYGRSWVKPFVDMRSPIDASQAARLSPRMRYMMGCNANAPTRG
ncbi:phytanoyl-CoA dioxygenase family protein [Ilumatobacter sp.]|uniref:phytanoyl-CoA dioxygenase family protein n=1 Tax=Ilumatobacter sp. TaxID=1967498 RepID=UPI003752F606